MNEYFHIATLSGQTKDTLSGHIQILLLKYGPFLHDRLRLSLRDQGSWKKNVLLTP